MRYKITCMHIIMQRVLDRMWALDNEHFIPITSKICALYCTDDSTSARCLPVRKGQRVDLLQPKYILKAVCTSPRYFTFLLLLHWN